MSDRDGYIPGVPCWADVSLPDPEAAAPFYRRLLGWELTDRMPPGSEERYLVATIRGRDVAALASAPPGTSPAWSTYVWVDSADEVAARAPGAGGQVLMQPSDVPGAGRMAVVADPEGAELRLWQAGEQRGAGVVNEHGAVVFNTLATRDPERAEAFYGALLSWRRLQLPGTALWMLPGYGDHLEERTPGLRDQMAAMGAPEGFIDVVAAISPLDPGDGAAPHWSVTFSVDDVDAVAKEVEELGGAVLAGPSDAPWTREALVRDPQGATFVVSQFVPENAPS